MNKDFLRVSEGPYLSLQGEGKTAGCRAIFLRLQACDFCCSWCDTLEVWKKGNPVIFSELLFYFQVKGFTQELRKGTHLVVTGGNPLLQEKSLAYFIFDWLLPDLKRLGNGLHLEVETQGSMRGELLEEFAQNRGIPSIQWNVSPKLENSGVPLERRINKDVLVWFSQVNSIFKFPVTGAPEEIKEINHVIHLCNIAPHKIWLMPICSTREEFVARSENVANLALKNGFNYSPRLQLLLWDRTTGV